MNPAFATIASALALQSKARVYPKVAEHVVQNLAQRPHRHPSVLSRPLFISWFNKCQQAGTRTWKSYPRSRTFRPSQHRP